MTPHHLAKTTVAKLALVCAFGAVVLLPARASAQGAQLKLDQLDQLASRAKEHVEIALDPQMLAMASGFLTGNQKNLTDIIAGLKGVYVRNYEFDKERAYSDQDVNSVRAQLKAPWARIVNVQNNSENKESVEVYLWPDGPQAGGLAIVVAAPTELTVVNIVGRIDLAKLAALGGTLGIPKNLGALGIPGQAAAAPPAPPAAPAAPAPRGTPAPAPAPAPPAPPNSR